MGGVGVFIIPFVGEIARIIRWRDEARLGVKKLKIKSRKGPYQSPVVKGAGLECLGAQGVRELCIFLW